MGRNGVSCATCHSTVQDEGREGDGLRRAGHSLFGVAYRPYWRGDVKRASHPTLADAVDICVQLFQGGSNLEGRDRMAFLAYLKSVSPTKPQPVLRLEPSLEADLNYDREKYRGGDADGGRTLFFKTCHACHPRGASGLGPSLRGKTLADIAKKAREGNGLLRGARKAAEWMPFFGLDRLTDKELADIAAYVGTLDAEK